MRSFICVDEKMRFLALVKSKDPPSLSFVRFDRRNG
jgi:hypothetical protein